MSENAELVSQLTDITKNADRAPGLKKIFIGLPNMCTLNTGLVSKLFHWGSQRQYEPWFHLLVEQRPTDYARNLIVMEFLKSPCEYLLMIDADVDVPKEILTLADTGKDIISANVHCWIRGELMSSLWQKAACEQCFVVSKFQETEEVHDPKQYRAWGANLDRWNPFSGTWDNFFTRVVGSPKGNMHRKCRCMGTGKDPFVYQTYQNSFQPGELLRLDSVGAAAVMINRKVIEAMDPPWFQFLYKPDRSYLLTEDHYFCWKAGLLGFEVWGAPEMACSHFKTIDLAGVNLAVMKAFKAGMQLQKKTEPNILIPNTEDQVPCELAAHSASKTSPESATKSTEPTANLSGTILNFPGMEPPNGKKDPPATE